MNGALLQKIIRVALVCSLTLGATSVFAWTGPTAAPPGGTVPATPVNIGATAQTKSGPISAFGLTSTNGIDVSNASGAYTYITLHDDESPNGVKYIHANSNVIGFLSGAGSWLSYWDNAGGQHNTAGATFGGNVGIGSATYATNGDVYMSYSGSWLSGVLGWNGSGYNINTGNQGHKAGGGWGWAASGGYCQIANNWTGGCSCPGWAPVATNIMSMNDRTGTWYSAYVCSGN